jgi:hypothetical protein
LAQIKALFAGEWLRRSFQLGKVVIGVREAQSSRRKRLILGVKISRFSHAGALARIDNAGGSGG